MPGGARLAPQVPEHGSLRQAQFPGDPGGRVASLVEFVDSIEPLDQLPTFRPLGLESWRLRDRLDRRSRRGRFGSRYRRVGLRGYWIAVRPRRGFQGLEGRVEGRRVPLEHLLDGLAQVLQQVPAVRDLPGLRGTFGR